MKAAQAMALRPSRGGAECTRAFVGSGGFELLEIHCGVLPEAGEVTLVSGGVPGGLRVDGLVAAPGEVMPEAIGFLPAGREVVPECVSAPAERYDTFSGKGLRKGYAVWWSCQEAARREYWLRDLAHLVSYSNNLRHPFYYTFPDSEAGNVYCRDIYTLPIEIPAGGEALFHVLYCAGANAGAAKRRLQSLDRSEAHLEARFREQSCVLRPQCAASGRRYRQGRDMLAAAVLTNVNFPIRAMASAGEASRALHFSWKDSADWGQWPHG